LAKHVAPRGQDAASDGGLSAGGDRHVHDLDSVVGQKGVEVLVNTLDAMTVSNLPGPVEVKVHDADDVEATASIGGQVGDVGNDPGTDEGDAPAMVRVYLDRTRFGDRPEQVDHGFSLPRHHPPAHVASLSVEVAFQGWTIIRPKFRLPRGSR
jgi:hypothetical protein